MKRTDLSRKEATHERIVEVAGRAIRRTGYGGTGVADIMKEAGLTHGGFYAHFASREAMLAEAADRAGAEAVAALARIAAAAPPQQALPVAGARIPLEGARRGRRDRVRGRRPRLGDAASGA